MDRLQVRLAALSMVVDLYKSMDDSRVFIPDMVDTAQIFNTFLLEDITQFEAEKEAAESEGEIISVDFGKGERVDETPPEEV